jgi:pseudouridine-5'-phosphate glycosidase
MKSFLDILPSVRSALLSNRPVIALESTIISHGMPFPQNLLVARQLENEIRSRNCTPATIAIMNGKVKIGLEDHELELLAREGRSAIKTSRRDFGHVLAQGLMGATYKPLF